MALEENRFHPAPTTLQRAVAPFLQAGLHEFVGESAESDVRLTMAEINRVVKPSGVAIVATVAGDPEKGLPHVQNFSEAMFDSVIAEFRDCIEKKVYDDLGCTGRPDYKIWFGNLAKK